MFPEWQLAVFRVVVGSSLRAVAVAVTVGFILSVARVRSAGTRHALWTMVLAAMMLMPLLERVVPGIPLPAVAQGAPPITLGWPAAPPPASLDAALAVDAASGVAAPPPATGFSAVAARPARAAPTGQERDWRRDWPAAVAAAYLLGLVLLLARMVGGWLLARRLVLASRPVGEARDIGPRVYEADELATPVTIGPLSPAVFLPSSWRDWPEDTRRAVLAHELAHVRRCDPLIAFLAHLNRCVFWFHPLAWWLERKLAATAEDACDEAAVRTIGESRRYAEVLLEMANVARAHGRRLSWQGAGVDGTGLLGRRIDRVLAGQFATVSRRRKCVVAVACATAVFLVAACRQQTSETPAAALRPDPEVTDSLRRQQESQRYYEGIRDMTPAQAVELEAAVAKNPEDLEARTKLMIFYRFGGPKGTDWNHAAAVRRNNIVWMIEHHPDSDALSQWGTIEPRYDPAGFAAARKAWIAATSGGDVSTGILSTAAWFFSATDKPLAEQLLLRAQGMDPAGPQTRVKDNVYYEGWSGRLGSLYARAILGVIDPMERSANDAEAHSAFAREARQKLDGSGSAEMLYAAGSYLLQRRFEMGGVTFDLDVDTLGKAYLTRAAELDSAFARRVRMQLARHSGMERSRTLFEGVPPDKRAGIVMALPDAERLAVLPQQAETELMHAEFLQYTKKDEVAAKAAWTQTLTYADDLLSLSQKRPNDPNASRGRFAAHVVLGVLALHDNDRDAALKHTEAAGQVLPSEALEHDIDFTWSRLATGLLKRGERESVARFLERYAELNESQRDRLRKNAAAIRAGTMPDFYQYVVARTY